VSGARAEGFVDRARVRVVAAGASLAERVALSAGSARVHEAADRGAVPYARDAFVPAPPWRSATDDELAALAAPPAARDEDDDVLVLDAGALVAALRATLAGAASERDLRAASIGPAFAGALAENVDRVAMYCRDPGGLRYAGAAVTAAGLRTVTIDGARRPLERTGLHVDSWDGGAADGRARSRRRLCINAGREARYLLFVPRKVSSLAREEAYAGAPVNAIAASLLASSPALPIVRLRIDPGEAYVASTEDLVHDASTEGATEPDLALHFIGHFGAPDAAATI
jgi:hypothetical protein